MDRKFIGSWQITKSEQWHPEMLHMDKNAIIETDKDGFGSINFCAVQADIEYRASKVDKDIVEFSFNGVDVRDPVNGRGWFKLEGEKLKMQLFFHRGMESWFEAEKI